MNNNYATAAKSLPADAVWSSTFGTPGDGGYCEYWRQPDGTRWVISNGPWYLIEPEFDWSCQRLEERKPG